VEGRVAERTLVLLRHAKSDWSGDEPDLRRGLAKRGRRQAPEAGRWLASNLAPLDLAVVSPATRARRTWQLAAEELDPAPPVRVEEELYGATDDELLGVVRGLEDGLRTVVLVGHNPGLEELASRLADRWVTMPTSALAVFRLSGGWRSANPHTATLRASGRPPVPFVG
jgi:phosphohistidine phosphatase